MDERERDEVLSSLKPTKTGWRSALSPAHAVFFGKPVSIDISTRAYPADGSPPAIEQEERDLAHSILAHLPGVLREAEQRFTRYTADHDAEACDRIRNPEIWIQREILIEDGPHRWTLVVEREDDPDLGYHIEFIGIKVKEVWAGD